MCTSRSNHLSICIRLSFARTCANSLRTRANKNGTIFSPAPPLPLCLRTQYCNTVQQHTATYCNILQHTATHCNTLQHTATHCNTLQHTATPYNTLQHTATLCNTLQHTAAVSKGAVFSNIGAVVWGGAFSVGGC